MKNKKCFKLCVAVLDKARYGTSKGMSILISVVLISLVVLFSIGVTTLVTESTRQSANVKQGTTAYYAAEAGIEQALWVNQKLASNGASIGADEKISQQTIGSAVTTTKYKIQGTTSSLVEKTVNGHYIIPFPWTGNVPWHGEGAIQGSGGCNPEKPPKRSSGDPADIGKTFSYPGVSPDQYEIDHPCNWGRLRVGEKAVIPLFGKNGSTPFSFNDFKLRVRTPCKDNQEFCAPADRLELNCFDKGSHEKKCVSTWPGSTKNNLRGEVVLLWQINAENTSSDSTSVTLNPFESVGTNIYDGFDTQLFEGKITSQGDSDLVKTFEVLDTLTASFPAAPVGFTYPAGKDLSTGNTMEVQSFVASHYKPTLSLSVVGSLVGCNGQYSCAKGEDDPTQPGYTGYHGIPYLEYQVILPSSAGTYPPANLENVISAEGQSGPFNQTIQVKVPNDNSTLEYVIQQ